MSERPRRSHVVYVARSLLLDQAAVTAVGHLAAAGVPSILLKGAAIATWLYDEGELRPYGDIDLLVRGAQFETATELLAELGYTYPLLGAHPAELGPKERELRGPNGVWIDLHHGLIGVPAPPHQLWDTLAQHTVALTLSGGSDVRVLDRPARAMHLALHAAQDGLIDLKALADLGRGVTKVGRDEWQAAAKLAEELGATEAFSAGLRLVPAGAALAEELALPRRMSVELALRTRSDPQDAIFFVRLAETSGARAKAALVARKLFPTTVYLRANSALAVRGRFGLAVTRLGRLLSLAKRLGPAFAAWRRARRITTSGDS